MARQKDNKTFCFRGIVLKGLLNKTILSLTAGLALFVFPSALFAQIKSSKSTVDWIGKYEFEDVGRRRSRIELVPSVYYVLELSKNKRTAGTNCSFYATGFQTNEEYQCSVKTSSNNLSVYFEKDLVHTSDEDKEFIKFKRGQLLFSLIKSQTGKTARYQFQPAGYEILLFSEKKKAIFFTRAK